MDWLGLLQWPAFAASVVAAWLVASQRETRRRRGFWVFLFSNVLWVAWGLPTQAYALVALQVCLAAMNIRGLCRNGRDAREAQTAGTDAAPGGGKPPNARPGR